MSKYNVQVADGYAVFETNHLSVFALAAQPGVGIGGIPTPSLGDNYMMIISICVMLCSAGFVLLLMRHSKRAESSN